MLIAYLCLVELIHCRYTPTNVASYIIGASFSKEQTNIDLSSFVANITLNKLFYGPNNADCMYWDTATQSWSASGMTKIKETDEYVVCQTTHLTSFSVLMTRDDSFIPQTHKTVLDIISVAGCGVSVICLIATVVGLVRFPHIRRLTDSIIHINFSASLFGALLVFLIFIDLTSYGTLCKAGLFKNYNYSYRSQQIAPKY